MSNPTFSIITPTYNRGQLLGKTVESLLNQSFSDFELIIVDDGSTDNTEQIVKSFTDGRIHYYRVSNRERGAARNFGTSVANGKYVNFFDSDDMAYTNHLELAKQLINDDIPVFALGYDVRDNENHLIKQVCLEQKVSDFICDGNHLSCNGVFMRKEIAQANAFSEIRELSGSEDYELWLRLSAKYEFPCIPTVSHAVIHHENRSTLNFNPEPLINRKQIMLELGKSNEVVRSRYRGQWRLLEGTTYAYIALHIALSGKRKTEAVKWWLKSILSRPTLFLERRSLATWKHILTTR